MFLCVGRLERCYVAGMGIAEQLAAKSAEAVLYLPPLSLVFVVLGVAVRYVWQGRSIVGRPACRQGR